MKKPKNIKALDTAYNELTAAQKKEIDRRIALADKGKEKYYTLVEFRQKLKAFKNKSLTERQEEIALLNAMKEVDRTKFVSKKTVLKKLRKP